MRVLPLLEIVPCTDPLLYVQRPSVCWMPVPLMRPDPETVPEYGDDSPLSSVMVIWNVPLTLHVNTTLPGYDAWNPQLPVSASLVAVPL